MSIKVIGILGGSSDQATAEYYRLLNQAVRLLGTRAAMAADSHLSRRYAERFGIEVVVPDGAEQEKVDRVIFDELCRGAFLPESRAAYLEIMERLRGRGAESVILGCTEIPLLVTQEDRPGFPMFNTTALHAEAAVALALEGDGGGDRRKAAP